MNREIKFRGKRIDNNEWIYGYYSTSIEEGDNGGIECNYRKTCVELHYINNILVYPETVTQYINLKDIEGIKEIYEGDFVTREGWDDELLEIIYYEEDFAFKTKEHIQGKQYFWNSPTSELINYKCYTIIGNRFDNPELIVWK